LEGLTKAEMVLLMRFSENDLCMSFVDFDLLLKRNYA